MTALVKIPIGDKSKVQQVITIYSPICLGQETQVKFPPAHLSTTHGGGFTQSLIAERSLT